MVSVVVFE
ncbi:hypothetical protein VCHC59A1_3207A, partial [Vibrio cholerae HC-59A1]